jgi:hypothetical protein
MQLQLHIQGTLVSLVMVVVLQLQLQAQNAAEAEAGQPGTLSCDACSAAAAQPCLAFVLYCGECSMR